MANVTAVIHRLSPLCTVGDIQYAASPGARHIGELKAVVLDEKGERLQPELIFTSTFRCDGTVTEGQANAEVRSQVKAWAKKNGHKLTIY